MILLKILLLISLVNVSIEKCLDHPGISYCHLLNPYLCVHVKYFSQKVCCSKCLELIQNHKGPITTTENINIIGYDEYNFEFDLYNQVDKKLETPMKPTKSNYGMYRYTFVMISC